MRVLSLRFSKACKTYEEWAIPQRISAQTLINFDSVELPLLDVGCGTGFVSSHVKGAVGVDISINMLKLYKSKGNRAVLGDAHSLPFKCKTFNTVISNFALHWTHLETSFREIFRVCKKTFLCGIPVEGSLKELNFPFPTQEGILSLVEGLGGKIRKVKRMRIDIPFESWDLIRFFHYTGTSYNPNLKGVIISRRELQKMVSLVKNPYFDVLFFSCEVGE